MKMDQLTEIISKDIIENVLYELNGNRDTFILKTVFANLFKDTEYEIYTTLSKGGHGQELISQNLEWLYDLVVVREIPCETVGKQTFLTETVLALESEMCSNFNHVMYDFQKLLTCNSRYKVMLFRDHSKILGEYYRYMEDNIKLYQNSNGIFFLIGYSNDKMNYEVKEVYGNLSNLF